VVAGGEELSAVQKAWRIKKQVMLGKCISCFASYFSVFRFDLFFCFTRHLPAPWLVVKTGGRVPGGGCHSVVHCDAVYGSQKKLIFIFFVSFFRWHCGGIAIAVFRWHSPGSGVCRGVDFFSFWKKNILFSGEKMLPTPIVPRVVYRVLIWVNCNLCQETHVK